MSLERELGYWFNEPELLRNALTHRSVTSEDPTRSNNERLEFLGDAVLQLVITHLLYKGYAELSEGEMAKVRAAAVSKPALAEVARSLELGRYLDLAPSEDRTGGREKDSILSDAMESVIGAVYLDGGMTEAGSLVGRLWMDRLAEIALMPGIKDFKTRLQELLARDGRRPVYRVEGSGPDHDRWFTAQVLVEDQTVGEGAGKSKKQAEQAAAEMAIGRLTTESR